MQTGYHKKHRDIIRALVLARSAFKCQVCLRQSLSLHVHHIDANKANYKPTNLCALCSSCHARYGSNGFRMLNMPVTVVDSSFEFFNNAISLAVSVYALDVMHSV